MPQFGEYTNPDDPVPYQRKRFRVVFLNQISKLVPECWESLYKGKDIAEKALKNPEISYLDIAILKSNSKKLNELYNFLNNWSDKFNLYDDWIKNISLQILECWVKADNDELGLYIFYERANNLSFSSSTKKENLEFNPVETSEIELGSMPKPSERTIEVTWEIFENEVEFKKKLEKKLNQELKE